MRGPTHVNHNTILKLFPLPHFIDLPSVGIDISDFSIKFIEFLRTRQGIVLGRYGEEALGGGVVSGGSIVKRDKLVAALRNLKHKHGFHFIRASLPEETGFLFESTIPRGMREREARSALQFKLQENVPLSPDQAIFDYEVIGYDDTKRRDQVDVVVSVFPRDEVEKYLSIFHDADLVPLSLEIEAQAIARAVVKEGDLNTYLIVDFGKKRSGISVVTGGAIRFATTVEVGGDDLDQALQKRYPQMSKKELNTIKNERGIRRTREGGEVATALMKTVESLHEEINKHYVYWHTHEGNKKGRGSRVSKVLLCGGNANLAGLPEYLTRSLSIPVERANVWANAFSIESYIPPISFEDSLGYAPAIGLALHSDTQRVIPA